MYIKRALESVVLKMSRNFPVVLITGPRQTGKTTLLQMLKADGRHYVTLDDPMLRQLAINEPSLFFERNPPPVIVDEIQYAPELLPYIKMHVDKQQNMGDFWLTGSQAFHLMKGVSESLAGRVGIINMLGLSNSELQGRESQVYTTDLKALMAKAGQAKQQTVMEIYDLIVKGSMPAVYTRESITAEEFYSAYIQTYLQRDIKDLMQVGDELAFLRFLTATAARTGQLLNYAELAKDSEISPPTAKQWFSILVTSGIIKVVEPYFNNTLKRIIKAPKFYFLDTGIAAYLTRWHNPEVLEAGAMSGAFFETWVVSEIVKSYYNAGKQAPLYYYRDKEQKEIDLIIHENGTLYPIEIKKSGNPSRSAIKNFSVLEKTGQKIGQGNVICLTKDMLPIDRDNFFVPAWMI
ncbi:MAG: ATP-binding protein [Deferribacteraceae bacterium]|jgi:predicted AAA+ superfamily ATPase|nr:ATP-binding protein [Deferribacteraceae bacterium]